MSSVDKISTLVISDERMPVAAYQAIYHRITQNTERITKRPKHAYCISLDNVKDLYRLLEQSIQQYEVEAKNLSFNISFEDGELESYSSYERFSLVNFEIRNDSTKSFYFVFDFLVVLPVEIPNAPDIAQRYKVSLTFLSAKDLFAINLRSDDDDDVASDGELTTIIIEYADRAVANHLLVVVEN